MDKFLIRATQTELQDILPSGTWITNMSLTFDFVLHWHQMLFVIPSSLTCATNWSTCLGMTRKKPLRTTVQFSHSVVFDSLWPHERQHARPPCPSPTPRVHLNPCPLSRWCHPTISSSVVPFSCLQSIPASQFFLVSQLFASGGQSVASVLPVNIQEWFPLGWTGLISF